MELRLGSSPLCKCLSNGGEVVPRTTTTKEVEHLRNRYIDLRRSSFSHGTFHSIGASSRRTPTSVRAPLPSGEYTKPLQLGYVHRSTSLAFVHTALSDPTSLQTQSPPRIKYATASANACPNTNDMKPAHTMVFSLNTFVLRPLLEPPHGVVRVLSIPLRSMRQLLRPLEQFPVLHRVVVGDCATIQVDPHDEVPVVDRRVLRVVLLRLPADIHPNLRVYQQRLAQCSCQRNSVVVQLLEGMVPVRSSVQVSDEVPHSEVSAVIRTFAVCTVTEFQLPTIFHGKPSKSNRLIRRIRREMTPRSIST